MSARRCGGQALESGHELHPIVRRRRLAAGQDEFVAGPVDEDRGPAAAGLGRAVAEQAPSVMRVIGEVSTGSSWPPRLPRLRTARREPHLLTNSYGECKSVRGRPIQGVPGCPFSASRAASTGVNAFLEETR